jgi:hypothetical protein
VAAMCSKRASDLVDNTRICGLKLHTALSECYEAQPDFSPGSIHNLSSNGNIAIVGMLDVNINACQMADSVVVGIIFCPFIFSCQIAGR